MQIQNSRCTPVTFRGYDARPLKGLFLRYTNTFPEDFEQVIYNLDSIGKKEGFELYIQGFSKIYNRMFKSLIKDELPIQNLDGSAWSQDHITFLPGEILADEQILFKRNEKVANYFGLGLETDSQFVPGGNYFIVNNNGKKEVLLGRYHEDYIEELKNEIGTESVKILPQSDFHLDLFIRPLKNKVVLLADDKMLFNQISEVVDRIECDKTLMFDLKVRSVAEKLKEIKDCISDEMDKFEDNYDSLEDVQQALTDYGYKPIRVPGRCYVMRKLYGAWVPTHFLNYMNAIVHENKNGELVYITNKSGLNKCSFITDDISKKIGFDFETNFKNSVKDYIKPENIYFLDTKEFLQRGNGGIHCLTSEIPLFDVCV